MANKSTRKILTPIGTLSFPKLAEENDKGKYSCAIVFAPGTDLTELDALIEEAKEVCVPSGVNKKALKIPMQRDGSVKEEYGGPYVEGACFFECSTNFPPGIVDAKRQDIIDVKGELYPGAQVRLQVHCYYFDNESKGIAFGLDNVQKAGEGERLGTEIPEAADVCDEIDTSDLTGE